MNSEIGLSDVDLFTLRLLSRSGAGREGSCPHRLRK